MSLNSEIFSLRSAVIRVKREMKGLDQAKQLSEFKNTKHAQ